MTAQLILRSRDLARVRQHATACYPAECCGILLGRAADRSIEVEGLVEATNTTSQDPNRRFTISPKLLLDTHRAARAAAQKVVGYYHSHPDHPARPSLTDREHAWPDVSYLIISVSQGHPGEIRSWRLPNATADFLEELWILTDASTEPEPLA